MQFWHQMIDSFDLLYCEPNWTSANPETSSQIYLEQLELISGSLDPIQYVVDQGRLETTEYILD